MKKLFLLAIFTGICFTVILAQKKQINYDQAFNMKPVNITKQLPQIIKWLDDDHYVESRRETDGKMKTYSVEVKTGKAVPFEDKKEPAKQKKDFASLIKDAKNVTWSPDDQWVAYTKENNLYIRNAETEKDIQLTTDGTEMIKNGYASWVYFEEILGRGSRYRAFWWSPDSKKICYMRFDDTQVPTFPIYVIKDQHGYLENEHYPKAGDKNPEVKVGVVDIESKKTVWSDFNEKDDQYFGTPVWTPTGQLWVQWMNRGQDNLKIYNIDLNNGAKTEVYDEKQTTWVDLDQGNRIEFLPSKTGFIIKSDKSGWAHFYLHDMNGKFICQLTNGDFTVGTIFKIDEKAKLIYFNARKENSARWDLYSVTFDGKKITRHSFGEYSFAGMNISPNAKYFITSYSNISTPTVMALIDMKGKVIREMGNVKGEEFANYELPKKELYRVKSADGLFDLPVTIVYPVNFDPNIKYPVLASIYGGPNAGRIMDTWNSSTQEIWWAQEGLIQVVFDNRSSGHFGKKGMNFIHRQMGKYEIEDYMQCGKWLREKKFVDANRMGITGGSFGGYISCMALTYGADVFTHGVANASVTDWQFYDTHYTERYMDTPQENPEGYKATSVMTYADKLKGKLRIVHGTSDDNVHMQNSMMLINKLQDLKKHFEFMLYPGERHGIGANNRAKGEHNRTEAYNFYYQYLLQKPMPEDFWKPSIQQARPF
ncbi:MAG TPA: DPP IV N-terminal domain-containing protein [Chitinophagaceae bacterium]|nr:DPP IV N-terminal domain-containing protein [Chitinophagaceae bacterium]